VKILALITLKNNFPYENEELVNSYAKGFNMDKQIQLLKGKKSDKYSVFDTNGKYLFSFVEPKTPIFNEIWAQIGFIAYALAFFIFFILYSKSPFFLRKKVLEASPFLILSGSIGLITGLLLYFNLPDLFFSNKLFTPYQYAANPILTSITHLSFLTAYFLSTIYLFYFHTRLNLRKSLINRLAVQLLSVLYFLLLYYILSGLIYHSSIQLSILHFKDFSVITIWIHFLILVWSIGLAMLFFKTHKLLHSKQHVKPVLLSDVILGFVLLVLCLLFFQQDTIRIFISFTILWSGYYMYFLFPKTKNIYGFIAIWVLLFSVFLVWNSLVIENNKKMDKYKILAQNIYINGNSENDRMADILLEDLDIKINKDKYIGKILIKKDSSSVANNYLNKTYLRGFWSKYEMRLNVAAIHSELYNDYAQFIVKTGTRIKTTHFYSVPANENNMSYIGQFQSNTNPSDSVFFFMEFYPRRNFKSYSFPDLLITSSADIQTQLNISIAKYEHNRLVYSSGKVEFSTESNWIPKNKSDFFKLNNKGHVNYIYSPNSKTYIVITEQELYEPLTIWLYFIYTFLAFFTVCCLIVWIYFLSLRKWNYRLGLTTKFQYTFIILLIISFVGIFFVSVNYIEEKYKEQQIANLESKKSYIQKELQEMYYWNQDLNNQNTQTLNFYLQDLSYIYHTDIHVYDNRGQLIGSSQPIIFNKNLIGTRISPTPYFKTNSTVNQYEHIGKLNYLTGYTDFYNGDYLQIGFIAIPQFFSQDEIKTEIESFLSVIIHIYLIIIVLAVLLSIFIGKQLSAPLILLENKLKDMQLGRRNEKIDYSLNDEIGQLVIQYNRTIDELEQSAKLLAQSERESAWKSMARQVAHEINNPLTPMKLSIQQLQRTRKLNNKQFDEYFVKSTAMLIEQIDNLSHIAGTFSDFARMPEAKFERIDIATSLFSVFQLFATNKEHFNIEYYGPEKDVFVNADGEQMVQVFNNLLKNAIQAIPDDREGKIQIKLYQKAEKIIIEIIDNGIGIEKEVSDKLFVPNFTTKSTGTGLGLAISKNIIDMTGGTITFTSNLNKGTTFTVVLSSTF
jgi:signal transduction histidine kinase